VNNVRFAASGRFTWHGWRLDVYIDFLGLAASAGKLATEEEEERRGNDDYKDHQYGHDCSAAATTIIISHKIDPPLCIHQSLFVNNVIVCRQELEGGRKN